MLRVEYINSANDPRISGYQSIREKDLTGREGLFIAEGKVVLAVLFGSSSFRAQSLLVLENRLQGLRPLLEQHRPDCPIYVASEKIMDSIAGFHVHRGILGLGVRKDTPDISSFLQQMPEEALLVVLCGISNHDNMGSIFRNAAAFGADGVVMDATSCDPLYRKAIRVSVGAALKVPFARVSNITMILDALDAEDFTAIAFSPDAATKLVDAPRGKRMALVFGTEGDGLPQTVMQRLQTVRIPIAADFDSLNVATSSGIALAHFAFPERLR